MKNIPERYVPTEKEIAWVKAWEDSQVYRWDPKRPRSETFVVDTPPPTVSGSLHIGHVFSYTQTDCVVRYKRMCGMNIYYPMGWDDNGLPTERRVQNYMGIRCDPSLPYDTGFKPTLDQVEKKEPTPISRQNFIEACTLLTRNDEAAFEHMWRRLGLSVDWTQQYATIDEHCRRTAQKAFIGLVGQGNSYSTFAPTMWDVDFTSAIAQAEIEDREVPGTFVDVRFAVEGGGEVVIATTRPELIVSCIALVAHPDDARYKDLFGKSALTPLFLSKIPILPSLHADPEKGTGIMMTSTFGDLADVVWWKASGLPLKHSLDKRGRFLNFQHGAAPFESTNAVIANENYSKVIGLRANQARKKSIELLAVEGSGPHGSGTALKGEPRQIKHAVKFFEKGENPVEFIPTRQWFIRTVEHKEALLAQGRKVKWHPEHMQSRYEDWVRGLNQDWCISRQRFFGVPFPVWYPVDAAGETNFEAPILANFDQLPVDPLIAAPQGYDESSRGKPNGFIGDPDVMDTWATSSLTPQIASRWATDPERHEKLFPMDVRPQAHEIIRTWAFSTLTQSWMHSNEIPWKNVLISGWVLDPDRKKMSKSKGNVVTPERLFDSYSADAVRYWSARARLGSDTTLDEAVFKVGQRLVTKIFNASRFLAMQLAASSSDRAFTLNDVVVPLDVALLDRLSVLVEEATEAFSSFDHAVALQKTESEFWKFCDYYVELVKVRVYQGTDPEKYSACAALRIAIGVFLRLFAPFVPFVTEEVWSWFADDQSSVHKAPWPKASELTAGKSDHYEQIFQCAFALTDKIRQTKASAGKGQRWPVATVDISVSPGCAPALRSVLSDIVTAASATIERTTIKEVDGIDVLSAEVTLETENPNAKEVLEKA